LSTAIEPRETITNTLQALKVRHIVRWLFHGGSGPQKHKTFTSKIMDLIDLQSVDYKISKIKNVHKKQENNGL
jgi:hypothetical protein